MCEKCDERCAAVLFARFEKRRLQAAKTLGLEAFTVPWEELPEERRPGAVEDARAVREAGRLSECPEAVEAMIEANENVPEDATDVEAASQLLRAAEDAALGKK